MLKRVTHQFKYGAAREVALALARQLASGIPADWGIRAVWCAVPMHAARQRERSYNQAEVLAQR